MRVRCGAICLIALFGTWSNEEISASKQLAPQSSRTPCVCGRSAHNEHNGGLEILGAMGRRQAEETKLKSNSLTLRVFRRLWKEEI
jgi:hypothetical protein